MRKTIYRNICIILTITIVLTTFCTFWIYYEGFSRSVKSSIRDDGQILVNLLNTHDNNKERVHVLQDMLKDDQYNRITLIQQDGTVIFDNAGDVSEMDSHNQRPEVEAAQKNGEGESVRKSRTLGRSIYYCAYRLKDDSVLRIARATDDIYYVFIRILPIMLGITLLILVLAFYTTKRVVKRIMQPINHIGARRGL